MKNLKNTNVCYPTDETYYIGWNDDRTTILIYGSILSSQCFETKIEEIDFYTKEIDWVNILIDNGINPFPEQ